MKDEIFNLEEQHTNPVGFKVFKPVMVAKEKQKPVGSRKPVVIQEDVRQVDKEMEERIKEFFFRRDILEGLGSYAYKFNLIVGGIFKAQEGQYYKFIDASQLLKDGVNTPAMELVDEQLAKKRTYHKTDQVNINFLVRIFPFLGNVEKNSCVQLVMRDEAHSTCGLHEIDADST